ncbi:FGGY-family carbohydrate kinase [Paenibacillus qinlingensis]|uniref:Sugar (Pentulose or hexulose) kinase n=1 Tax=Paenibacillus qinlingensis TaxID=1837343 RepID=A0ABU1NX04_9BACL|nr:FGGY-family carbohydrate kinase [Paenibacillus qinlingensis]MDR6552011.1 sugar (pentulose or hexulose) kinase [Paenibacillus qinlingensis]
MNSSKLVFIGADIGSQGVRVMALDEQGELLAADAVTFELANTREEQSPALWWEALTGCLSRIVHDLKTLHAGISIEALSVTSTSGTMIPLDERNEPLGPALMYSDPRSQLEAKACTLAAQGDPCAYTTFHASSGLPKIIWFGNQYPHLMERTKRWVHAADYLIGKLSGVWGVTDYTNCLKTGYDLVRDRWPSYISEKLGIPSEWLPTVVAPGTVLGTISVEASQLTGLPAQVRIVAGMTDGCASQIASGAIRPGEWNTTIGTTMVVKGVTQQPILDPLGRLYNHKHPQGFWMPGGASNTGADWVSRDYQGADLAVLNQRAGEMTPTPWVAYPLRQKGERFPFVAEDACGFEPQGLTPEQRFAARMEGVAYLERLSYDIIEGLSGERLSAIYTAGGASNSLVWLQIRSSVSGRPIQKMKHTEGAAGAAVLAASQTRFSNLEEAGSAMIRPALTVEPAAPSVCEQYEMRYKQFVQQLRDNGFYHEGKVQVG